jgi:hypothetical protein
VSLALHEKPDSPVEQIAPGWFGGWFLRSFIEPSPATKQAPAPPKIRPTAKVGASVLERFLAGNESCRELMVRRARNRLSLNLDTPTVRENVSFPKATSRIFRVLYLNHSYVHIHPLIYEELDHANTSLHVRQSSSR